MMYNTRDSNNNYEEGIQDVSYEVVEKKAQMDHVDNVPEHFIQSAIWEHPLLERGPS